MKGLKMKIAKMIRDAVLLGVMLNLMADANPAMAQMTNPPSATTPTRPPDAAHARSARAGICHGYANCPTALFRSADTDGNFIIGPTHHRAAEITTNAGARNRL